MPRVTPLARHAALAAVLGILAGLAARAGADSCIVLSAYTLHSPEVDQGPSSDVAFPGLLLATLPPLDARPIALRGIDADEDFLVVLEQQP